MSEESYFQYRLVFPHTTCGMEFIVRAIEWPPKVIICPHCAEVMKLETFEAGTGASYYLRSGNYWDSHD